MNAEKTGKYIAEIRGAIGLTQKELADRIGVTDKAVSKWETGRGFPDIGVLEILAKELGVSVTELVNGERLEPKKASSQSDSAILETLQYVKRMSRKTFGVLIIIIGACLSLSPLIATSAGFPILILSIIGIPAIMGGVLMLTIKSTGKSIRIPSKAYEFISLGELIAALVLELLPNGVVIWWAAPPGKPPYSETFSYFDPLPFGVAHFSPLITAILTSAVTILTIIAVILGKKHTKLRNALFVCLIVTAAVSACPILYGIKYVTVIGVIITLLLAISTIFRAAANAKK